MAEATELEQLIRGLNSPANQSQPEVIDAIQKGIQRLQREPQAWQWGIDLLNHDEAVMRFYGALTLTIKVNADWVTDGIAEDRDAVSHLLENLVSNYVRLASAADALFVLQKLCTTLVAVFQKPQSAWALPLRHLTACFIAGRYVPQDAAPALGDLLASDSVISGTQLRSLLIFPMTLAEQDGAISGMVKEQSIRVRISNNVLDIWQLLHFVAICLGGQGNRASQLSTPSYRLQVGYDPVQFIDVAKTMLQLIPLWAHDVKIKGPRDDAGNSHSHFDHFEATVNILPKLFQQGELASSVLQTLTVLEESSHRLLQRAIPGYEKDIISSPQAAAWIQQLLSGDFDPDAMMYVNFLEACMSQVDVTLPAYLSNASYVEMLKQVRMLLQCDGAAGVDDTICQVALEILTSVTEGFSDWPEPSPYDESMKELITAACSSVLNKIQIPSELLSIGTQTWDADDRAKFQDFRYDAQDYLQNAFGILGDALIEEITKTIVQASLLSDWGLYEAGLFGFVALSDTLSNEPERSDKYINAVFDCKQWHAIVGAEVDVPDRVRRMMIKVIGENTGFLQRQTAFLVPSLNFLFTSLHLEHSTTAASRAIYTLCDAQRTMLTEALPQFMASLDNVANIEADAKRRIYAAVGALIQALPTEDVKLEPLTRILRRLNQDEIDGEVDPLASHSELLTRAVDVLQTMSSLGRGLRAPSDAPVDLEKDNNANESFWTNGIGSSVQQQLVRMHNTLLQHTNGQQDPLFVEAACTLLRMGFTEEHPSPFKLPNKQILGLLSNYIELYCPQPEHVMSTASSYLSSVTPADQGNEFHTLLMATIRPINETYVKHHTDGQPLNADFCTAVLGFYSRFLPKWAPTFFNQPEAYEVASLVMEVALLQLNDSDTLTRRGAASFISSFIESSAQPSLMSQPATSAVITNAMESFLPRVTASLVHLLGGVCARSDIEHLGETLRKAVQHQPLATNRLLKDAMKNENAILTTRALQATKPELRMRTAEQIAMLRGSRRSNEVIREFWIACRGREFEYIG